MERFPFPDTARNTVWINAIAWTQALVSWWAHTELADTPVATAEPKRPRYTILHTPARIVKRARQLHVRWPTHWPWTPVLHHLTE